jgi:hypothetical protein
MRHNIVRRSGRRAVAVAAVAITAIPLGAAFATPAQAEGPAVVDPMLTIFRFGATFGIPTGCPLLTAAGLDVARRFGADAQFSPIVTQINTGCDEMAVAFGDYIDQGKKAATALSFINEFANPAIGQVATAVSGFGTDYGDVVAPFGNTVAGLGGTINFFQGK